MKKIPVRTIKTPQFERDFLEGFTIRDISEVLSGAPLLHKLHRHNFYFILAIEQGNGHHEIDFIPYPIHPNSLFLVRPGQVHQLELQPESTGYLLQFDNEFLSYQEATLRTVVQKASAKNYYSMTKEEFSTIWPLLTTIYNEQIQKQEGYKELTISALNIFFIGLLRQRQSSGGSVLPSHHYEQERLEEFLRLIEIHSVTKKKTAQYAEVMNLSTYQLNTITKALLGKTGTELIDQQIILEAKRYLLATAEQVKEIAYHLGFEDHSYFIRFFKKHTGYSPEAFREISK